MSASARRLATLAAHDMRVLHRRGFVGAYAVITVLYVVFLLLVPQGARDLALPVLLFTDPAVMGFFFVVATILLDRQDGTIAPLFVTPTAPFEYLASRAVVLTALATVTCGLIATPASHVRWAVLALAVALSSSLFIAVGVAIASRFRTFNQCLGVSFLVAPPLFAPIALQVFALDVPGVGLLPAGAALRLFLAAFTPGAPVVGADVGLVLAWNGVLWAWAGAWFTRYGAGRIVARNAA